MNGNFSYLTDRFPVVERTQVDSDFSVPSGTADVYYDITGLTTSITTPVDGMTILCVYYINRAYTGFVPATDDTNYHMRFKWEETTTSTESGCISGLRISGGYVITPVPPVYAQETYAKQGIVLADTFTATTAGTYTFQAIYNKNVNGDVAATFYAPMRMSLLAIYPQ